MSQPLRQHAGLIPCVGCGGLVADDAGPTHAYMLAAPGCWSLYGEWSATRAFDPATDAFARTHHVDCYAVQHPGNADVDRRQRQSIAVHLIALCLHFDFQEPLSRANVHRSTASDTVLAALGLDDWPYLATPAGAADVTIVDVAAAARGDEGPAVRRWAESTWSLWAEHHATVRLWAEILAGR